MTVVTEIVVVFGMFVAPSKIVTLIARSAVDGFVAGPNDELDWMEWNCDDETRNYVNELTDSVDVECSFSGHYITAPRDSWVTTSRPKRRNITMDPDIDVNEFATGLRGY